MAYGRIETSSAEQLVELRKARDRYKALADRFRDEGDAVASQFESESDPLIVMQEKLKHERDALRIVSAYEKSIANIEASSEAMQQAQGSRLGVQSIAVRLIVLVIFLIAGAIFLFIAYPGTYRQALARLPAGWVFANRAAPAPVINDTPTSVPPAAPSPVVKQAQPQPRPELVTAPVPPKKSSKAVKAPAPATEDEGGFTTKVLQPDGTLKERHFSAKPRR